MAVFDITKENFEAEGPCVPCARSCGLLGPVVRLLPAARPCGRAGRGREDGRLAVGMLNIDDAPELAARYGISASRR